MKKLTKRQEGALKRHAKHHTASGLRKLRKRMEGGKSFTEAHKGIPKKTAKKRR